MNYTFRALTQADGPVIWQMLMHAAHELSLEAVKSQPILARYAVDWGRPGDDGFVALANGQPAGAVWLRLWLAADKGFGFIDNATPELAIAVLPECQGAGLGTQLLTLALQQAQSVYPAISLSVRANNPANRLYERVGFVKVDGSEVINRTGSVSFSMIKTFPC